MDALAELLALQDGVVARRQLMESGLTRNDLARMVRRKELFVVHAGVYVDHNGPLTWRQRAWAAVLWAWPAGLDGWSAVRAHEGPGRRGDWGRPIHVVVDRDRRLSPPDGVLLRRASRFDEVVQWNLAPPRLRLDGRLFHDDTQARDRDMERDLDTALTGADTVRLGYGQVFERSCPTAMKLGALFRLRGWAGKPRACPDCS